eukprot:CAMPEP_0175136854 /NCGR_PEP_ID=MMETSP0087-20121206/9501_1 /TAXON_ID=136419 /ORGANISM="Unknown Unknown, Strain D1" /LENGTH=283 /DNA_ID=CAMNT_0016419645 /DNA_START=22 /DNA_END=873 /DNA_ORIENTATION=-
MNEQSADSESNRQALLRKAEREREDYLAMMKGFWQKELAKIDQIDFNNLKHPLPLARIKKIMKSDEDVRMISQEAPILFSKACELFVLDLTIRAWSHTDQNNRRTLQRSDVAAAINSNEMFDFLVDLVPRDEPEAAPSSSITSSNTLTTLQQKQQNHTQQFQQFRQQQQQQQSDGQQQQQGNALHQQRLQLDFQLQQIQQQQHQMQQMQQMQQQLTSSSSSSSSSLSPFPSPSLPSSSSSASSASPPSESSLPSSSDIPLAKKARVEEASESTPQNAATGSEL